MNTLSKRDISQLKSFKAPPQVVVDTMVLFCTILDCEEKSFAQAKKLLLDDKFLEQIKTLNVEELSPDAKQAVKEFVQKPHNSFENVRKNSQECANLVFYLNALEELITVSKFVYGGIILKAEPANRNMSASKSAQKPRAASLSQTRDQFHSEAALKTVEYKPEIAPVETLQETKFTVFEEVPISEQKVVS